jgi:hypothetical protein
LLGISGQKDKFFADRFSGSIQFCDLRSGTDEPTIAVNHQEVTVGKRDGTGVIADDNVDAVVIVPHFADLNMAQIHWLTKSVEHLFSYDVRKRLTFIVFHFVFFGLLALKFVRHRILFDLF